MRKHISTRTRFEVLKRDGFTCQYCGRKAPNVELHVDHVQAVVRGGKNDMDNLTSACADCNLGKGPVDLRKSKPHPVNLYISRNTDYRTAGERRAKEVALEVTGWSSISSEHLECLWAAVHAIGIEFLEAALREHISDHSTLAEKADVIERIIVYGLRTIARIVDEDMDGEAEGGAAV